MKSFLSGTAMFLFFLFLPAAAIYVAGAFIQADIGWLARAGMESVRMAIVAITFAWLIAMAIFSSV